MEVGTKIKIIKTKSGCYGAEGKIGVVTEKTNTDGLCGYKPGYKVLNGTKSGAIEKVIFNPPATIVLWNDGTKTVVKCHVKDRYSKEVGLAMCISKKLLDNRDDFYEEFKKWIQDEPIDACQSFESIGASFGRACEAFRVGFLKGVEEFNKTLKAKETEDIPVEEMRIRLENYCEDTAHCDKCPFNNESWICEFTRIRNNTYVMTDDEIRVAYKIVFGKKKED